MFIGHRCFGYINIGQSLLWRRFEISFGFIRKPSAGDGEIAWKFHKSFVPARWVVITYRTLHPVCLNGGEWLSRRWTGRDWEIIGLQVGRRYWHFA